MLFKEATPTERPGIVSCARHGDRREAFVCRHLLHGSGLGFIQADDAQDNPCPDAWCSNCERVRQTHGGEWPEDSQTLTPIALVCGDCYQEIKAKNLLVSEHNPPIQ